MKRSNKTTLLVIGGLALLYFITRNKRRTVIVDPSPDTTGPTILTVS
jgi:hypothetical protein